MSGWKDMGTGARTLVLAGGAAVIVGAGVVIFKGQSPAPNPAETAKTTAPASEPSKTVATETAAPAAAPATETAAAAPAAKPEPPAFDIVRVSPEGDALVAGRALAGAEVSVKIDGVEKASAVADPQGKFVAMFALPPSATPRVVQLSMQPETGEAIASADEVVLAPTPATAAATDAGATGTTADETQVAQAETAAEGGTQAAPAAGDTAQADAAQTEPTSSATASTEGATTETTTTAASETQPAAEAAGTAATAGNDSEPEAAGSETSTAVLVTDSGAKVLQGASGLPDNVTIGAISYSSTGAVQLSGHGKAGAPLRLYLDNKPVLEATVGADGSWSGTLGEVEPGIYTLRADQLDATGDVTSRYETPFQREAPDALAALRSKTGKPVNITVQPGFTLWEIAKENYGDGVMYVRVFEANKAQIKDPDLIYPGQVFAVPKKD